MKNLFNYITVLFLFFFSINGISQNNHSSHFNFGTGISKLSYDYRGNARIGFIPYSKYGKSFYFGSGINQKLYKYISLDISLNLSNSIFKDYEENPIGPFELSGINYIDVTEDKIKIQYFNMPINFVFNRKKISFFSGIQLSYLMQAQRITKEYFKTATGSRHNLRTEKKGLEFRKVDLGISLGISYYIGNILNLNLKYFNSIINNSSKFGRELKYYRNFTQIEFGLEIKI